MSDHWQAGEETRTVMRSVWEFKKRIIAYNNTRKAIEEEYKVEYDKSR